MDNVRGNMIKTSKVISIGFTVAAILSVVGVVISLVSLIVVCVTGKLVPLRYAFDFVIIGAYFTDMPSEITNISTMKALYVLLTLYYFIVWIIFHKIAKMFRTVYVKQTPFIERFDVQLRIIAVLYFCISTFPDLADGTIFFGISTSGIAGTAFIWCMGYLLEYGCALQKESDETL